MVKTFKSIILWTLAALVCIVMLSVQTQAAEFKFGPGDHYDTEGNIVALDGTMLVKADGTVVENPYAESNAVIGTVVKSEDKKASSASSEKKAAKNYTQIETTDGTVYNFEGCRYVKKSSYGTHKLTGYAEEESGTAKTYSGKIAKPYHTVSAPSDLPIGTVIIVEGVSGPYALEYNGLYVVEDRGGAVLEEQGLIDIFCASNAEADHVTAAGWNYADIWIAKSIG